MAWSGCSPKHGTCNLVGQLDDALSIDGDNGRFVVHRYAFSNLNKAHRDQQLVRFKQLAGEWHAAVLHTWPLVALQKNAAACSCSVVVPACVHVQHWLQHAMVHSTPHHALPCSSDCRRTITLSWQHYLCRLLAYVQLCCRVLCQLLLLLRLSVVARSTPWVVLQQVHSVLAINSRCGALADLKCWGHTPCHQHQRPMRCSCTSSQTHT